MFFIYLLIFISFGYYIYTLYEKLLKEDEKLSTRIEKRKREVESLDHKLSALSKELDSVKQKDLPHSQNENQTVEVKEMDFGQVREFELVPSTNIQQSDENALITKDNENLSFYLGAPQKDGKFLDKQKTYEFVPGRSIYKFKYLNDEKSEASFSLIKDKDVLKRVLNFVSSFLSPVCEDNNSYSSAVSGIDFIKPGIALKIEDYWVVSKENYAVIKFY